MLGPLTTAAVFLVVTIEPGQEGDTAMRAMGEAIGALVRSIGFRHLEGELSCVMGIGSAAWDRIVAPGDSTARPRYLHPFRAIEAGPRSAPATPGDLLFHIRAVRFDLCFELARAILRQLGADRVHRRRGARVSLLRSEGPAGIRRRHGEPGGGRDGGGGTHW